MTFMVNVVWSGDDGPVPWDDLEPLGGRETYLSDAMVVGGHVYYHLTYEFKRFPWELRSIALALRSKHGLIIDAEWAPETLLTIEEWLMEHGFEHQQEVLTRLRERIGALLCASE